MSKNLFNHRLILLIQAEILHAAELENMSEMIEVDVRRTLNLHMIKKLMIKLNAVCLSVTNRV